MKKVVNMIKRCFVSKTFFIILSVLLSSIFLAPTSYASVECRAVEVNQQAVIKPSVPSSIRQIYPLSITLHTNCGDIEIQTDGKATPITLTVITSLLLDSYYRYSICHRLTTQGIFVLQCGDPTGTGASDPGFRFKDENLPSGGANNYPRGTVAMANSGPNTNGSQFFITYRDTTLGPNYTPWGRVVSGIEVIDYISSQGVVGGGSDGKPNQALQILGYSEKFEPGIQDFIDKQVLSKYFNTLNKAESDLKFAISSRLSAESEKTRLANENIELQRQVNNLKLEFERATLNYKELVANTDKIAQDLASLQTNTRKILETNLFLRSKLNKICKAKPKPKGC